MTWLTAVHYGLVAGLRYEEMRRMAPGVICDLYVLRQRYDDTEHGIRRSRQRMYD